MTDTYSKTIIDAVEAVKNAVVKIERYSVVKNKETASGTGTGFIFSSDGYLFTNSHVVHSSARLKVVLYDGSSHIAQLVGEDASNDIAILKYRLLIFR